MERMICYRCVAAGLSLENCVRYRDDMEESPSTRDLICLHCYDTELEFGYRRMSKKQAEKVLARVKLYKAQLAREIR